MPQTDINTILKDGANTKIETVDYSSFAKKEELIQLKKKSETALKNKYSNPDKLSKLIIKPRV